jgi:hypothetical protein
MEYRNYEITTGNGYCLKQIKPKGRGSVPKPLRGMFTNDISAKKSIDFYLDNLVEKEDDNTKHTKRSK